MKLKHLKKLLDKMTEEQLNQEFFYNSKGLSISGTVLSINKAKANLWYTGDDDPSTLYTMKELKEEFEYDKYEIESFTLEIPKGALVLNF